MNTKLTPKKRSELKLQYHHPQHTSPAGSSSKMELMFDTKSCGIGLESSSSADSAHCTGKHLLEPPPCSHHQGTPSLFQFPSPGHSLPVPSFHHQGWFLCHGSQGLHSTHCTSGGQSSPKVKPALPTAPASPITQSPGVTPWFGFPSL